MFKKYCIKLKNIIVFSLILKLILLNRYGVTLIVLYLHRESEKNPRLTSAIAWSNCQTLFDVNNFW